MVFPDLFRTRRLAPLPNRREGFGEGQRTGLWHHHGANGACGLLGTAAACREASSRRQGGQSGRQSVETAGDGAGTTHEASRPPSSSAASFPALSLPVGEGPQLSASGEPRRVTRSALHAAPRSQSSSDYWVPGGRFTSACEAADTGCGGPGQARWAAARMETPSSQAPRESWVPPGLQARNSGVGFRSPAPAHPACRSARPGWGSPLTHPQTPRQRKDLP